MWAKELVSGPACEAEAGRASEVVEEEAEQSEAPDEATEGW